MTDEHIYAVWNATPHSIDKLRMIAEFGRTLYRMGQEEMRERAREAVHCRECVSAIDALEAEP